jgi:hypothetical protein
MTHEDDIPFHLLTWDELPADAERIAWDFEPPPGLPPQQREQALRAATHDMVLHSLFAHCVRYCCTVWGMPAKRCRKRPCGRNGRCMTRRAGKEPPGAMALFYHRVMPACIAPKEFERVRDVTRDAILQSRQLDAG